MPVIIREKRTIAGREQLVKLYVPTDDILSKEEREQAEELDDFLDVKMKKIEEKLHKKGLLELKGRKGVLRLWFELGRELSFVDNTKLIRESDKRWLWRAIYDHAPNLAPIHPRPSQLVLARNRRAENERNHFRYCYLIAKFSDFGFVESVGDWSSWIDLLDSPTIREDERILEWIASKHPSSSEDSTRKDWLRKIINGIRHEFPAVAGAMTDTMMLDDIELKERLETMYHKIFS